MSTLPRVIHFVTGGGSGATKVAIDVACGHLRTGNFSTLLVLRRKKVALPQSMQKQIAAAGLQTAWVDNGPKRKTLAQLAALIADFRPQVFASHGNSEHFWGRKASFACHVPVVIHVEHSIERYRLWRKWSARSLAKRTTATVCVSHGVAAYVREMRLASPRVEVIHNGIDASRWSGGSRPLDQRPPDIAMMARFAGQKDHPTLIRAIKLLADRGWTGRLLLGGGGKASNRRACERLVSRLGLSDRVQFLGVVGNGPELLRSCRAAVLATHHEGLPLALVEYLAAGCAAIATDVPGVTDIVQSGVNGWLVPRETPWVLADALAKVLKGGEEVQSVVDRGQQHATVDFSMHKMVAAYEALFTELIAKKI